MLQIGGDFGFENANEWFKNLDILIAAVNEEGRVNVRERYRTYVTIEYAKVCVCHRPRF